MLLPSRQEITLVHGDFRTGNLMVSPRGLEAVLDWEFAHWGAPEEDLAWLCVRDWRFGRLDKPWTFGNEYLVRGRHEKRWKRILAARTGGSGTA